MSNARMFFAGVGTTVLLIAAGFGGGLLLARTALDTAPQNAAAGTGQQVARAERREPARVVLPASADEASTASASAPAVRPTVPSTEITVPSQITNAHDVQTGKDSEARRAEQRRAEAGEIGRSRREARRKARREAARLVRQQEQQQQDAGWQQRPGMMAFDSGEDRRGPAGFFGN